MSRMVGITVFSALVAACGTTSLGEDVAVVGEPFQVEFGETARIPDAGFDLTFVALVDDSRCPDGATCIWQGNASVVVSLSEVEVSLNTALDPREASFQRYIVRLLAVEPYPRLGEEYQPIDYVITLLVAEE